MIYQDGYKYNEKRKKKNREKKREERRRGSWSRIEREPERDETTEVIERIVAVLKMMEAGGIINWKPKH